MRTRRAVRGRRLRAGATDPHIDHIGDRARVHADGELTGPVDARRVAGVPHPGAATHAPPELHHVTALKVVAVDRQCAIVAIGRHRRGRDRGDNRDHCRYCYRDRRGRRIRVGGVAGAVVGAHAIHVARASDDRAIQVAVVEIGGDLHKVGGATWRPLDLEPVLV